MIYMEREIKKHVIYKIEPGSIAEELELEPGDTLLSINGNEVGRVKDHPPLLAPTWNFPSPSRPQNSQY